MPGHGGPNQARDDACLCDMKAPFDNFIIFSDDTVHMNRSLLVPAKDGGQ